MSCLFERLLFDLLDMYRILHVFTMLEKWGFWHVHLPLKSKNNSIYHNHMDNLVFLLPECANSQINVRYNVQVSVLFNSVSTIFIFPPCMLDFILTGETPWFNAALLYDLHNRTIIVWVGCRLMEHRLNWQCLKPINLCQYTNQVMIE